MGVHVRASVDETKETRATGSWEEKKRDTLFCRASLVSRLKSRASSFTRRTKKKERLLGAVYTERDAVDRNSVQLYLPLPSPLRISCANVTGHIKSDCLPCVWSLKRTKQNWSISLLVSVTDRPHLAECEQNIFTFQYREPYNTE